MVPPRKDGTAVTDRSRRHGRWSAPSSGLRPPSPPAGAGGEGRSRRGCAGGEGSRSWLSRDQTHGFREIRRMVFARSEIASALLPPGASTGGEGGRRPDEGGPSRASRSPPSGRRHRSGHRRPGTAFLGRFFAAAFPPGCLSIPWRRIRLISPITSSVLFPKWSFTPKMISIEK